MKKAFLKLSVFAVLLSLLIVPAAVSAGQPDFVNIGSGNVGLNLPGQDAAEPEEAIVDAIIDVINTVLGLLGLIAVIIIIVGGFKYMASGGDTEKTKNARKLLIAGLVGLIIIVFAYLIAGWVLTTLYAI